MHVHVPFRDKFPLTIPTTPYIDIGTYGGMILDTITRRDAELATRALHMVCTYVIGFGTAD